MRPDFAPPASPTRQLAKATGITTLALFAPQIAAAHSGLHHHPHGVEGLWIGVGLVLVAAVAGWLWQRR